MKVINVVQWTNGMENMKSLSLIFAQIEAFKHAVNAIQMGKCRHILTFCGHYL